MPKPLIGSPTFAALFVLLCVIPAGAGRAAALPRSAPEAQGVSSAALLEFIDEADARVDAMNSFMLVRHGSVVAEGWWAPYNAESNHELYSLSKSFTSTAVGLAVADGKLSLDDEVLKFFPEDAPAEPGDNLKGMRVRDLLSMSTGHQDEPSSAADKVCPRTFLAQPVPHKPGTHFKYNTAATFMLSAMVQKQTGSTVLEYLRPRLFEPLGISKPAWNTNFQGVSLGGYGLRVRTEDIAKLGQLYLQQGVWEGKRILPASWVTAATSRQTSNGSNPKSDWDQGYGYQFWRCRHGAYRGDGAFGQYCVVLPDQDAVIAVTSGVKDMQAVLNLIWDKLLPAFHAQPLPADPPLEKRLQVRLAGLSLRRPQGSPTSPRAADSRTYVLPPAEGEIEAVRLSAAAGTNPGNLEVLARGAWTSFPIDNRQWHAQKIPIGPWTHEPAASAAAWSDDGTLVVKVCAFETPFYVTWKLRFDGDQVALDVENNAGFGGARKPPRIGRAVR